MEFEGFLRIDRDGEYTFHLTSDDGSKLFIDDTLVVDNDGIHAPATSDGPVELIKGMHRLVVAVFNGGGEVELDLEYEGGGPRPAVGRPGAHADEGRAPRRRGEPPSTARGRFADRPGPGREGRGAVRPVGCASCHHAPGRAAGHRLERSRRRAARQCSKAEGGCLAPTQAPGVLVSPERAPARGPGRGDQGLAQQARANARRRGRSSPGR